MKFLSIARPGTKSSGYTDNALAGKLVEFSPSGDRASKVVALCTQIQGGKAHVNLCLPNSNGILILSKSETIEVDSDALVPFDGVMLRRDVKQFESNRDVEGLKAVNIEKDGLTVDYKDVTFEGYGSTFGDPNTVDRDREYIMPKAYDASIREFKRNPVLLVDHSRSVKTMMGHYDKISIDENGLSLKGLVTNSQHPDAIHVRALVMEKSLKTLSVGGAFYYADDYKGIEEVTLYEVSLVAVPANPNAEFSVRSVDIDFAEKMFAFRAKRSGNQIRGC